MKKSYSAPSAELIALFPMEEIAANWLWKYNWGTFDGPASRTTIGDQKWDPYNSGDDGLYESIKYD